MFPIISFKNVDYLDYLEGFSCEIETGCSVLFVTSREDESTALTRLITGLSLTTRGSVLIDGRDMAGLEKNDLYALRRQIGIVQSNGGLVSNLKLWENITLPLMYHSGGVAPEDEKLACEYLERLGYSGNIMALPAHLTPYERRVAALVRMCMCQPRIVLYSDCFDGIPSASRTDFLRFTQEFHAAGKDRTSLYITSSANLVADMPVDRVVHLNEPEKTDSRKK